MTVLTSFLALLLYFADGDNLIHFTVPGTVAILVLERLWEKWQRRRNGNGNGNGNGGQGHPVHKSFADDEDRYWNKMKDVVTAPLAKVMEGTNEILGDLRDRAIKEEGRREAENVRAKAAANH